jgi:hypothetical protein
MKIPIKGAWEVRGGVLPNQTEPELTRRWEYSSLQYETDRLLMAQVNPDAPMDIRSGTKFMELRDEAMQYFTRVSDPRVLSWTEIRWTWT